MLDHFFRRVIGKLAPDNIRATMSHSTWWANWLPTVVAALLLCGCALAPAATPASIVTLTAEQIAAVRKGVQKALKDPESARFGDMIAGRDPQGVLYVCGWVNAKNSLGGYTGEKRFAGNIAEHTDPATKKLSIVFVVSSLGGGEAADVVTKVTCERSGLPLG
jgi:hypothetical protein